MEAKPLANRVLCLAAVFFTPNIPLFYLYNRNTGQNIAFGHFLIFGGALSLFSLGMYLLVSRFAHNHGKIVIVLTLFWVIFWFAVPLHNLVVRLIPVLTLELTFMVAFMVILIIGAALRRVPISRLTANTIAMMLCLLFAFNFIPGAYLAIAGGIRQAENEKSSGLPYELKTVFNADPDLPKPNIYWLHMDSMIGFDMIERYFGDPQTELKENLEKMGFVINESARLNAGYTKIAVPAMTCPDFYDSFLASEFERVANLIGARRINALIDAMSKKGFSIVDISSQTELIKAFSDAGYTTGVNIYNSQNILTDYAVDVQVQSGRIINVTDENLELLSELRKAGNMKDLIFNSSILKIYELFIDPVFRKFEPVPDSQYISALSVAVDKYTVVNSDFAGNMVNILKEMCYMATLDSPHIVFFNNDTAHFREFESIIGDITYDRPVVRTFYLDENGNFYTEKLPDPLDVQLYLPQHKYAVKQMLAQLDIILENDPDAVIVIQGDHGIHGYGNGYDENAMLERGYNLEDMLNLNFSVISAVRIPEKYGALTEPLDPLDISRYLVNNFVGKGNYEYLYYNN